MNAILLLICMIVMCRLYTYIYIYMGIKAWFPTKEDTKKKGTTHNSQRHVVCGRYSIS